MNVVGKVGSFISQGVYSVATPFHPFGGAVDVIVVRQQDGTFRSTPWYVRFGKFQGVLKGSEKFVHISVNGTEADFQMYLDNSGKAYFIHEEFSKEVDTDLRDQTPLDRTESDANGRYYDFQDEQESSVGFSEFNRNQFESLDDEQQRKSSDNDSEVVLVSVDGHMLTAPVSTSEESSDNIRLSTPQFHLVPADGEEEIVISEIVKNDDPEPRVTWEVGPQDEDDKIIKKQEVFQSCLELTELNETVKPIEISGLNDKEESSGEVFMARFEISLCGKELYGGMGIEAAEKAFEAHKVTPEKFKLAAESIANNETLIVRFKEKYFSWQKAAPHVLGLAAFNLDITLDPKEAIPVEEEALNSSTGNRRWTQWPNPFRRTKTLESNSSSEDFFVDTESVMSSSTADTIPVSHDSPKKQIVRSNVPTNEQIASLNLQDGQNSITFNFSTRVLGKQQVEAHLYLWKWNTRIVISDVDGTITKSDVLGQFMPLVGKDWSQSGVAKLFSAIKENGYQLLFLSARAIVQAYLTKNFLFNLKQDGKTLPNGPVVISPDGLFPSLFREVIRRAPHEFKIACLEDIRRLFPPDYNPFYAGFGNRDTDELSYKKIGIPKGKIFIINPKGEVAVSHSIDVKSYTNLHTLVNDMFPPTSLVEEEDFNSWNFWKVPLPDIDL